MLQRLKICYNILEIHLIYYIIVVLSILSILVSSYYTQYYKQTSFKLYYLKHSRIKF